MSFDGWIAHFFLIRSDILLSGWMFHSLFIPSLTEGRSWCLQMLAITNEAAVNIGVQLFVWTHVFNSFG